MLPQSRLRNLHGDLSPSSEHSTFSVRRKHPKAIAAARLQEARDRPKKTVHFSETVKVFRRSYVEDEEETQVSTSWYSEEDFQRFRNTFKNDCKRMAQHDPNSNKALIKLFQKCSDGVSFSMDKVLMEQLHKSLKDRSKIGLERFSGKDVFRDKRARRQKVWDYVNEIQDREFLDVDAKSDLIRIACEEISRPSVLFAQYIAFGATKVKVQKVSHNNKRQEIPDCPKVQIAAISAWRSYQSNFELLLYTIKLSFSSSERSRPSLCGCWIYKNYWYMIMLNNTNIHNTQLMRISFILVVIIFERTSSTVIFY